MKKNGWFSILLLVPLIFVVLSVSCKSTPPQPEPPPVTEPAPAPEPAPVQPAGPSQASLNALSSALTRAEEARKRALDFEGPSYFPSDWEGTETQYTAAGNLPKTTEAEVQQAASTYNAIADAYDEIFKKTIPLYAQAREDEIIAARDEVIATGLSGTFPEYLQKADGIALSALSQYEAGDYYAARDTAAKALMEYETLKTGADAFLVWQEIIDRDFAPYDPENFDKAEELAIAALAAHEAGESKAAQLGAEEALLRYNLVLATGWAAYAAERQAGAEEARRKALEIKANVAVWDTFGSADEIYNQAAAALKTERYENAAFLYFESETRFVAASAAAAEKRRLAEDAIRQAEEKLEASDETARQAEILIEGGSI
jgi:hypothetical protein